MQISVANSWSTLIQIINPKKEQYAIDLTDDILSRNRKKKNSK